MYLCSVFPQKTGRLILVAPDGIRVSPFYWFVTQNSAGRKLLKRVVERPRVFFNTGKILRYFNLVSVKRHQFALNNFDTKDKRKKVYNVWLIYRNVHIHVPAFRKLIQKYQIPVDMFFGQHDKIIPPSIGWYFRKGIEKIVSVTVLDGGHRLLTQETGQAISEKIINQGVA